MEEQPINDIELIPLGAALLDVLTHEIGHEAPALDVRPEWVSKKVAALYTAWQNLPRREDREEWAFTQSQVEPLIIQAINACKTGILSARDAVNQLRDEWHRTTELSLMQRLVEAPAEKKVQVITEMSAFYGSTNSHAVEMDMTNPPGPNEPMLNRDGTGLIFRRESTAIKAKAKSGKSHLAMIFASAMIAETQVMGFSRPEDTRPRRVLFVDTEQSTYSSWKLSRNILFMSGYDTRRNCELLTTINLRNMSTAERLPYLQGVVATGKYDCLILDGIKDLSRDVNDNIEADAIMNAVNSMCETYNIALLTVLHENPSKDTDKMRGHLGTELLNKAHDVFEISLDKQAGVFNIKHTDSRDIPIPMWAFRFNDDNEMVPCDTTEKESPNPSPQRETKEEKSAREWRQFRRAWEDNQNLSLTESDIIENLIRKCNMTRTTIQRRIYNYYAKGRIDKDGEGQGARYFLKPQEMTAWRIEQQNEEQLLAQRYQEQQQAESFDAQMQEPTPELPF